MTEKTTLKCGHTFIARLGDAPFCTYCGKIQRVIKREPYSPLPANGKTYRLVTDSNGTVEASSVLLTAADAVDMLAAEVLIHRLAGWRVSVSGEGLGVAISAERGESRRIVRVEEA